MNATDRPEPDDETARIDPQDQVEGHGHDAVVADPAQNRSMSVDGVREVYADAAEKADRFPRLERLFAGRYRRAQFGDVEGRVLDVACGAGTNFRYLPDSVDLVGIDLSPEMLAKARPKLEGLALDGHLRQMDAQDLEFDDDSFDAVVSAFSTCTFPDPVAALHEMARVCKPGGEIRLLEHGRSNVGPIARIQDWRAEAHYEKMGCRLNQEPVQVVRSAGLPIEDARESFFGIVTSITASPERR